MYSQRDIVNYYKYSHHPRSDEEPDLAAWRGVAWRAEYDEWGNQLSEENPENLEQLIRLPGQQYDEESGLYYNRHRYYEPGLGRYITQDPIGLEGGWNFYQYPLDPITDIDPLGLFVPLVIGGYYLSAQAVAWISTGLFAAAALSTPTGKQVLTNVTSTSLTKCEEQACPPCNPPAGTKFNKTTHYDHDHGDCKGKTGSQIHWHYQVYHQDSSCNCHLQKHAFGGCGVAPKPYIEMNLMKNIELTEDGIALIHDNKIWSINFNFDGGQTSIAPSLVIDIDYVNKCDSTLGNDDIVFHVCPAKLNFNGVSSFNIELSSDIEEELHYKADCLYIYRIDRVLTTNNRVYFKIIFCDEVGYIDLYADKAFLLIEESKTYKIKGRDSIPILLRGSM